MPIFDITDDNCSEAVFRYTDIFYDSYTAWCMDNRFRISPLEWVLKERFEDFREFCQSKFNFDVKISE